MYCQFLIFLCAFALFHSQNVKTEKDIQINSVEPQHAVDIMTADGHHVIFPYFSTNIQNVEEGRRESVRNVGIGIMEYLDQLFAKMLSNPSKKISLLGWLSVCKDLHKISSKIPSKHKKESDKFGSASGFNKYIKDILMRMINQSKGVEKQLKDSNAPKDYIKLRDDLHETIEAGIEALRVSPVGVYLAWADGHIKDVRTEELATNLMARLRYHGFAGLLNAIERLVKLVLVFTK